jgi:hypothetical protein
MKLIIAALLTLAGTSTLLHASPIAGGYCDEGTLDQYIALGATGCSFRLEGERVYDFTVSLPESVDPSTITMVFGGGGNDTATWQDATGHFFPLGATLSLKWSAGPAREMARVEWYQFDVNGNLTTHDLPATEQGEMTLTATIPDAYLGFQLEQVPLPPKLEGTPDFAGVPEPSTFLPLLGIGLVCGIRRYGVRNSSSL